jgi:hypothetical protein
LEFLSLGPSPLGTISSLFRGSRSASTAVPYRDIHGANGNVALHVEAKKFSRFSGSAGNGVVVTFYYIGSTRFRLQFFFKDGTQIGGDITSVTGIANIVTALAADATLSQYFIARSLDVTTQAMEDSGAGVANGQNMRGGTS